VALSRERVTRVKIQESMWLPDVFAVPAHMRQRRRENPERLVLLEKFPELPIHVMS
jgi:hypothetical protein